MEQTQIKLSVANKEFLIDCPAGNESALHNAATLLNNKLQLASPTDASSLEQTLIMIALNLCHDLTISRQNFAEYQRETRQKLAIVRQNIEKAHVD